MRIILIGDINGKAGRQILRARLPSLVAERQVDFSVANVENAADGFGVTPDLAEEFFDCGLDCLTSGNHIWDKAEIMDYIPGERRLLRPLNYPDSQPGSGAYVGESPGGVPVAVVNLMGRVFMPPCENPFKTIDAALPRLRERARVILVDMHAEATSEKSAMGWHLDGRVSAVVGTHTHVQTADETILPGGTAYITDLGMTGAYDSVIGIEKELALKRFLTGMPVRYATAKRDPRLCGVLLDVDETTGKTRAIERFQLRPESPASPGRPDAQPV
ncbi:MAG: TIGR00282 family metallophosphoesterase [Acidobacteria bacterium]|nr:MAG: TIGR00282 family metallophosphoesterase [Acidobacteriota bacterium]